MDAQRIRRAIVTVAAGVAAVALAVAGAQVARTAPSDSALRLPDLDQETPSQLAVTSDGASYRLGFASAVRNIGAGPLIIDGKRATAVDPTMSVDQAIERVDGGESVVPHVGRLEYAVSSSHQHWHLLHFDRYELSRVGSARTVLRDRKTGFCLGDRYEVTTRDVPSAVPDKVYRTNCGLRNTTLLEVREGISVGYGDDYKPFLEGQSLLLNGLGPGRYVLVHRANADRLLRELSYANNASSLLLQLRWRRGVPDIRILRVCPDSARCERPAAAAHAAAPFMPDDRGAAAVPGGWADLQWNFTGPFGVNAPAAWSNLIAARRPGGAGVVIAVVDTGVAYADRGGYRRSWDLGVTRFVPGYDFVDNDPFPFDLNGHGTHVASTIAEQTNNAYGLTGLAYGARIMPIRVLDRNGIGYPAVIAKGIRFAADHGAKIINLSLNFDPHVTEAELPELLESIAYARRRGSLVVSAAGNESADTVDYPARWPQALAVGATTENGCLAWYSNVGPGLDLVAPGGGSDANLPDDPACSAGRPGRPIYQMTLRGQNVADFWIADDYVGTSMATAHVSAIAALVVASRVLGRKPSPGAIATRLVRTARDLGAPGYDQRYGWGLVNAARATTPLRRTR
jgi:serine protease